MAHQGKSPVNEASATILRLMLEAPLLIFFQTPLLYVSPKVSSNVLARIMPAGEIHIVE